MRLRAFGKLARARSALNESLALAFDEP